MKDKLFLVSDIVSSVPKNRSNEQLTHMTLRKLLMLVTMSTNEPGARFSEVPKLFGPFRVSKFAQYLKNGEDV